jgi:Zn-dependent protease with chaperone function
LAYAEVAYAHIVNPKLLLITLGGGLIVLYGMLPRRDVFVPPGPRVLAEDEPELFAAIEEVARAAEQAPPAEVFLVTDVNAFVAQRGGILGFGGVRVMGVGMPLLQAVTVQEFKAVLAHEYGHYHAGDIRLGPWIYKTQASIGRMLRQVHGTVLHGIFLYYGKVFMRLTHAIARRQEFIADEMAARFAGAGAAISSLRKVHGAATAFPSFWQGELAPVLGAGFLPPIGQGFGSFLMSIRIAPVMEAVVRDAEERGETNPLDTHPSLRERVLALSALPQGDAGDTRSAASLLRHAQRWERSVLGKTVNDDWARGLQPLQWDKVADQVYLPLFRQRIAQFSDLLRPFTCGSVPTDLGVLAGLGARLTTSRETRPSEAERASRMLQLFSQAIVVALVDRGWTPSTVPGDEVLLSSGGRDVRPHLELSAVASGVALAQDRIARWDVLGVADVPLVAGAAGTAMAPGALTAYDV